MDTDYNVERRFDYYRNKYLKKYDNVNGIDCRTIGGDIFHMSDGYYCLYNTDDYGEPIELEDILSFLTMAKFGKSYNFFYRMKYDMSCILKLLSEEDLEFLYNFPFEGIVYEGEDNSYMIKGIPSKFMYIKKGNTPTKMFYNLSDMLHMDFVDACDEILDVDVSGDENKFDYNNIDYCKREKYNISISSKQNGNLIERLAREFINVWESNGFIFDNPRSLSTLGMINCIDKGKYPTLKGVPTEAISMAYKSFYGGLFDVWLLGTFDDVNSFDINAAYPSEMRKLVDLKNGTWSRCTDLTDLVTYGFYNVDLDIDFPLIPYKKSGEDLYYPIGEFNDVYVTKSELDFIDKYDIGEYDIKDGIEFISNEYEHKYPFKEYVDDLFNFRSNLRDEDSSLEGSIKYLMNTPYGKMVESHMNPEIVDDIGEHAEHVIWYKGKQIRYNNSIKCGRLFNPIYASYITVNTRLKCLELAIQSPEDVISIQTDSIQFKDGFVPKADFSGSELGHWDKEIEGDTYTILNTGIYEYHNSEKFRLRGIGRENTCRGVPDERGLVDLLNEYSDRREFLVSEFRPKTIGDYMSYRADLDDVGVYYNYRKKVDVNHVEKRRYYDEFENCNDVLCRSIKSRPYYVSELR